MKAALSPVVLGKLSLKNRLVMAPLTRTRADENNVPTPMMVKYYADRASAGLLIAEATQVNKDHNTFGYEPGIWNEDQVKAWRAVTDAVHAKGGLIVLQLHHGGRAAPAINSRTKTQPVAPSAIAIAGHRVPAYFAVDGQQHDYSVPRALEDSEIAGVIADFVNGAKNAIAAGFDGVEIHGANGYLLDQFWKDCSNKREGPYGGSLENRCRLHLEIAAAVSSAIGSDRVGIRLSPLNSYNGMEDSNPEAATKTMCAALDKLNLAYLHVMRADFFNKQSGDVIGWVKSVYSGKLMANMGYTLEEGAAAVGSGALDAVCLGRPFISNPDLVERAEKGLPLAESNPATYYARTEEGYNDYPAAA